MNIEFKNSIEDKNRTELMEKLVDYQYEIRDALREFQNAPVTDGRTEVREVASSLVKAVDRLIRTDPIFKYLGFIVDVRPTLFHITVEAVFMEPGK